MSIEVQLLDFDRDTFRSQCIAKLARCAGRNQLIGTGVQQKDGHIGSRALFQRSASRRADDRGNRGIRLKSSADGKASASRIAPQSATESSRTPGFVARNRAASSATRRQALAVTTLRAPSGRAASK